VDPVAHPGDAQAESVVVSVAVLVLCCVLWIAGLWSCRSAWDAIWERDWMELAWAVSRTAMLIFLAVVAGAAHDRWDEVRSVDGTSSHAPAPRPAG
jgi:hypothetical protein